MTAITLKTTQMVDLSDFVFLYRNNETNSEKRVLSVLKSPQIL